MRQRKMVRARAVSAATYVGGCVERGTFKFHKVRPIDDSNTRRDVVLFGSFVVHPDMNIGHWLANDIAVLRLDQPASSAVLVQPIPVSTSIPAVGSNVTLVRFGPTNGPAGECSVPGGVKRRTTTQLDARVVSGEGDLTLVTTDPIMNTCGGDSGGPMLDSLGRVVGVDSNGDRATSSAYDAVGAHAEWFALQSSSPGNRVGVWEPRWLLARPAGLRRRAR